MIKENNLYFSKLAGKIPFILSLQDREELSKTYGCLDRNYWGWKFTDFPEARLQEGVCSLACLYTFSFPGNILFENNKVLNWVLSGITYWATLQHNDGSFDEAYPYEHSLAATAFTSFYLGEAFLMLEDKIPLKSSENFKKIFQKAGEFLCVNSEKHGFLSNHLAAAAAGLYNIYIITRQQRFLDRCNYFLKTIYEHQSIEGWFEEYGGPDIGYQTHCLFFLARLWQHTKNKDLLSRLKRSVEFLSYFIHPDYTLGGEYGSRNTEFYFPAGLEIIAQESDLAASIAGFMREGIAKGKSTGLFSMDMNNFFPMFNNYLFAGLSLSKDTGKSELAFSLSFEKYFSDAQIYIKSTDVYYAVSGIGKGGVLKIFNKKSEKLIYSDCGYWGRLNNNSIVSSQSLDRKRNVLIKDSKINLESKFSKIRQKVFNPYLFIVFRLTSIILGRIPFFAYFLKKLLVNTLIYKKDKIDVFMTREIDFGEENISIIDNIVGLDKVAFSFLVRSEKFTSIHMGSAKYFQFNELDLPFLEENILKNSSRAERITLRKEIDCKAGS